MSKKPGFYRRSARLLTAVIGLQLALPLPLHAAQLNISQVPLAKSAAASVAPNLMFILDNSGSMAWDYLPDYIDDTGKCFDAGDDGSGSISDTRDGCKVGDVPYMSPDFNKAYYSPDVIYRAGINSDGTSKGDQTDLTNVQTDPYGTHRKDQLGNTTTTINLTTQYPDRVYCDSQGVSSADTTHCKINDGIYGNTVLGSINAGSLVLTVDNASRIAVGNTLAISGAGAAGAPLTTHVTAVSGTTITLATQAQTTVSGSSVTGTTDYQYPSAAFPYGTDGSNVKRRSGAPYYYRLATTYYCSNSTLTTCIQASAPSGSFTFPAKVRFCKDNATANTTPLTDCKEAYDNVSGHTIPHFLGYVQPATTAAAAYGTISITDATAGHTITDVKVDGISSINTTVTATGVGGAADYTGRAAAAAALVAAINSYSSTPEYRACQGVRSGDNTCSLITSGVTRNDFTVTIFPQTATGGSTAQTGAAANGRTIAVFGDALVPATKASGTITVSDWSPSGTDSLTRVTAVTVGGTAALASSVDAATGLDSSVKRNAMATALASAISSNGYTATVSTNVVTIIPPTAGVIENGKAIVITATRSARGSITIGDSGSDAPVQVTAVTVPSGGTDLVATTPTASTGTNSVGEQAAFAATLGAAINTTNYTVSTSGNLITLIRKTPGANTDSIGIAGTRSGTATFTILSSSGFSSPNTSISLSALKNGTTTMTSGTATAATGTNDAGEAAALATTLRGLFTGGYSATVASNVLSIYAPAGVTAFSVPTATQAPAVTAGTSSTANTVISNTTVSTVVTGMYINSGGSCTSPTGASNLMSGSTAGGSSGNSNGEVETQIAAKARSAAAIAAGVSYAGGAGSSITVTGPGSLNGCTLTVTKSSGDASFTTPTFGGGSGVVTQIYSATAAAGTSTLAFITTASMSGGIASTTSPNSFSIGVTMSGGTSPGPITVGTTPFAGGVALAPPMRADVGSFKRCDITATADCAGLGAGMFPRASTRTDCVAATHCTYAEEAKNFGNWYAYYRTRIQSMKTSAGLAFAGIGSNYRVGFVTIGRWESASGEGYLKINDFDTTHKSSWYTSLYGTSTPNATPLRHSLSSVGLLFAGKNPYGTGDDPMQYSCQQNFALLTTDGYWNEPWDSNIKKVDGTIMDNADGNPASVARPFYDGGMTSTTCGPGDNISGNPGRSCGTLADIAYHYYATDLRTTALNNCSGTLVPAVTGVSQDVCNNNVKGAGDDNITTQHMTVFTLGLGVDGTLKYTEDYKTATSGDYAEIKAGTKNWPAPKNLDPTAVDDLWHAAVSGRGQYFSAASPATLTRNLSEALLNIDKSLGSGAAAATSNLEPVDGDNFSYVASYTTNDWWGNLEARTITTTTGATQLQALWCIEDVAARAATPDTPATTACPGTLKTKVSTTSDTRKIVLFDPDDTDVVDGLPGQATNKLRSFTYPNLTAAEKLHFDPASPALSQYTTLPLATQALATGTSLVDYLRGQTGYEDEASNTHRIYRNRVASMGDAVGSQPVYVKKANFSYGDMGYAAFKTLINTSSPREGTVYIGTNDGMLHAFDATNGSERWAYVPLPMLPNMRRLADNTYGANHRYFVDGSPSVADACLDDCAGTPVWATVLVGGYAGGGKGFYAMDVTDPTAPRGLWELSSSNDADIGYSFGNAIITKRNDGKWVALFTSGHNNVGTGKGFLFVVDLKTGVILAKISTEEGDTTTPSGLSKIEAYLADATADNSTKHVYGGDLQGNVWRFTIDEDHEEVVKVAQVMDENSLPQPITTRPIVTELDDADHTRYIAVATGKLIETTDLTNDKEQSLYAFAEIYDTNGNKTVGGCVGCTDGARDQLTEVTLVGDGTDTYGRPKRKTSGDPADIIEPDADKKMQGCFVDLPISRERVNVDMRLTLGSLATISNVPGVDTCTAGGESYITFFDYKTCKVESGESYKIGDALAVGLVVLKLATGYVVTATLSNDPTPVVVGSVPPPPGTTGFQGRRVGWRLLFD